MNTVIILLRNFFMNKSQKIEWAISNLNSTYDEYDDKYPSYNQKEKVTKHSIFIIQKNLNIALDKIFKIFIDINSDEYSDSVARANNMIFHLSLLNEHRWLEYMLRFAGTKYMTESSFAAIVKSGSEQYFKAVCEKLLNIKIPNHIMFRILQEFMFFLTEEIIITKYQKNWTNIPEAICLLNQASHSDDFETREKSLIILNKASVPISSFDNEIKILIDTIINDPCDVATPSDVIKCEKAALELGHIINENHIELLFPLFHHHYWRVRKHAVLAGKNAFNRMKIPSEQKGLLKILLIKAVQDENETVRTIAQH